MAFSAEWLDLREPADRAARDAGLLRRAAAAAGPAPVIMDLGCGSGATVRAMAPHLPPDVRWRLVDTDAALLELAAAQAGPEAEIWRVDIADLDALPLDGATLVTASALLDLVSDPWLRALAARLRVPFYAALSYDGIMTWDPGDPRDASVTAAFNRHQRGDKGLGSALGPDAVAGASAALAAAGFEVERAESPWRLGPADAGLQRTLVEGIGAAAAEAGEATAPGWTATRRDAATTTACRIGHGDILATPAGIAG